ncbi:MAG: D-alanyl-D-alanine carboxypeptidase family protein [Lautropia sp.]
MARFTAPLAAPSLAVWLLATTLVAPPALPPAQAQASKKAPAARTPPPEKPAADVAATPGPNGPEVAANAWLLIDLATGTTLASRKPDERVEPASLTKLMTAYLVFNALKEKRLELDQRLPISMAAYKAGGSRMFLDPRQPATVGELLNGLIVQSGNDAAIVLAEALAGSEAQFAQQMTAEARKLGMNATSFRNASGLPDPEHYTTARDLATLASHLIAEHPSFYKLYSQREYTYNNIRQPNRNRLLFTDPSVDGMKTGHTEAAGYCLISSAKRTDASSGFSRRLLSVVLGASSEASRAIESQKLLNYGFQHFQVVRLYKKDDPIGSYKVYKAVNPEVKAGFDDDIVVTVARTQVDTVKGEIERVEPLVAPIAAGQPLGTLRVRVADKLIVERPVVALERIDAAGWFGRAWDTIKLWIK